jgi:hypothetical protein
VAAIVEAQPLVVAAGAGDRRQHLGVNRRAVAAGDRDRRGPHGVDPVAQPRRQHLLELEQRTDRGLLDPGHGAAGGGPQADGDGHRLVVVEQQRRQGRARAEPVAAGHTRGGVHRVAEAAQPLHVAPDGSGADLEPFGEHRAGPVPLCLEQSQQPQQPGRGFQHG